MSSYCHDQAIPMESYSSKQAAGYYLCDSFLQGVAAGLLLSTLTIVLLIKFGYVKSTQCITTYTDHTWRSWNVTLLTSVKGN